MPQSKTFPRALVSATLSALLVIAAGMSAAQAATTHFKSICRSDPAVNKNTVTLTLHDDWHNPLADVTINALWTFVDYRQNHAVFKYRQDSCTSDRNGVCTFNGGGGRARWQLSEIVGYDLGSPAFDDAATTLCPNTFMIDFW